MAAATYNIGADRHCHKLILSAFAAVLFTAYKDCLKSRTFAVSGGDHPFSRMADAASSVGGLIGLAGLVLQSATFLYTFLCLIMGWVGLVFPIGNLTY